MKIHKPALTNIDIFVSGTTQWLKPSGGDYDLSSMTGVHALKKIHIYINHRRAENIGNYIVLYSTYIFPICNQKKYMLTFLIFLYMRFSLSFLWE